MKRLLVILSGIILFYGVVNSKPQRGLAQEQTYISGKILLPDGQPLAGEKVKFVFLVQYMPPSTVKTKEDGSFKLIYNPRYGQAQEAKVFARDGELTATIDISDPDDEAKIEIKLEEGEEVTGKLYFKDKNAPLANATISVFIADIPINQIDNHVKKIKSNEDGSFQFKLAKGEYNLLVQKKGIHPLLQDIEVVPKKPLKLDIVLKECGSITGKVVDSGGKPVKGVSINLWLTRCEEPALQQLQVLPANNTRTKKDGTFKFNNLLFGSYRVGIQKGMQQGESQEVEVQEGEPATVEFEVEED